MVEDEDRFAEDEDDDEKRLWFLCNVGLEGDSFHFLPAIGTIPYLFVYRGLSAPCTRRLLPTVPHHLPPNTQYVTEVMHQNP